MVQHLHVVYTKAAEQAFLALATITHIRTTFKGCKGARQEARSQLHTSNGCFQSS
jgi:hypothetical protein